MATIGDKSAQSYGWLKKLDEDVPQGMTLTFPVPGFDRSYTDTRYTETTVSTLSNQVFRSTPSGEGQPDEDVGIHIDFDPGPDPPTATVANYTKTDWPAGATIYVFCPHLLAEGANEWDLKGQIWDLQQRVKTLEGATMQETQEAPEDDDEPPTPKKNHASKSAKHK